MVDFFVKLLSPMLDVLMRIQEAVMFGWFHHIDIVFYAFITLGAIFTYAFSRPDNVMSESFLESIGMGYVFATLLFFILFMASLVFSLLVMALVAAPFVIYAVLVFGICVLIGKMYTHIHKSVHKSIDAIFPKL